MTRTTLAIALLVVCASTVEAQPGGAPQVLNGLVEARAGGDLTAAIRGVPQGPTDVTWVGYAVPAEGRANRCCWKDSGDAGALEAAPLALGPRPHGGDGRRVAGEQARAQAQVVVHVRHRALDVVLRGFDGRLGGAKPELLVGVEAELLRDLDHLAELQVARQPFAVPAGDGLVPPHGPFPTRQAVHRLEVHDGAETFNVVHISLNSTLHRPALRRSLQPGKLRTCDRFASQ